MVELNFDASGVAPSENDFDVLPPGWYRAEIVGSEMKETNARNGHYLALQYRIIGPSDGSSKYENRRVFCNLNLDNPNPKAVEISERNLADICRSVGITTVGNSNQLHEKPHMIKLAIRKSEQYGDSNDVKGFKPMGGPGAPAQTAPVAAAGGTVAPAWATKS